MIDFCIENWIEIVGAITGLIYLYYEYKADIKIWPTGILMSSFYTIVFIQAKFYAFACINVYYIIAAIYGWIKWHKSHKDENSNDNSTAGISHTPLKYYIGIASACFVLFLLISYLLSEYTDSPVVLGDSFVTTLSIVAMWMLAQRFVEQWILVVILNAVSVVLYFMQDLYPTSVMYLIYTVVSVFGYFNWKRMVVIDK